MISSWFQVLVNLLTFAGMVYSLKQQGASGEVELRLEAKSIASGTVFRSDPPVRIGL